MTEDIWNLRRQKLRSKRRANLLQRLLHREFLTRAFRGWRDDTPAYMCAADESYNFECSLHCQSLRAGAQLWSQGFELRRKLQAAKKPVLDDRLQKLPNLQSASDSDILRILKPFLGSSNALKRGPRPLPFVVHEQGVPCHSPDAALARWIQFFMTMEGGERIEAERQRKLWIENLAHLATDTLDVDIAEVPTLVELQAAFRRVKKGKASGPDLLPSELFHCFPVATARHCYSVLLKTARVYYTKGEPLFPH